jgi:diguanylate cyclase (GGDEF)-like protein
MEGINLEPVKEEKSSVLRLGKATFFPLQKNDGAYINADNGGYQILLNYRGVKDSFTTISITDVLARRIPSDLMVDKIVLIGSTAESLNDAFYTPYSSVLNNHPIRSGGVIVHANIASQIVSAAIDGRPLIKTIPEALEWVWILNWAFIGALVSWKLIKNQHHDRDISAFASLLIISMLVPGGILVLSSYLFFVNGWWIPVVAPLLALSLSALCIPSYQNFEWRRIASVDHLTHIPNRSFFDAYLAEQWVIHLDKQQPLSVVLCDVDYFKLYNDNYGHQAGDECLKKVAWAIATAVRKTDMAARYGGEEFVIILPNTHTAMAIQVSERVCGQVRGLRLAHDKSTISNYVTLSCGSATTIPDQDDCLEDLLKKADLALYKAKEQGRNQVVNH